MIDFATRRVEIAGVKSQPHSGWFRSVLRRQLDGFNEFLRTHMHLVHDRDPMFTQALIDMLAPCGVRTVKLPPRSPNLNAYAERFVRSTKHECLNRIIPIGEHRLTDAIDANVAHYNRDRSHQCLDNELLTPKPTPACPHGKIICYEQLGGLIRSYRRTA